MKVVIHLPYELTREELQEYALERAVSAVLTKQTFKLVRVTVKAFERGSRELTEAKATF